MLGTEEWDDLDGGTDTLKGYRSVLHGSRPSLRGYGTWQNELDGIVRQVKERQDEHGSVSSAGPGSAPSIGVAAPTRAQVADIEAALNDAGITATTVGNDGPRIHDAVHVGTLHRFKGLEYQHMLIAGAAAGTIPSSRIESLRTNDPHRYARELKQSRSLLFTAATRARDSLTITWHETPCPFLRQ